jgi:DNA polymerase-3 subunit epsilon/ATP-dependent DNA helicase DinG
MPDEFVAIDLETTGLDPASDRITEVGATRFSRSGGASTAESFHSMVDPGRPIPFVVQELTGISDADVRGAATITSVGAELAAFCGGRPVVGQSIPFDLTFLRAAGVELGGTPLDTLDLGSVLLPTATRLDLGSLAELLGVGPETQHRALADAETTRDVFLRLLTLLDRLPRATRIDLLTFAERAGWPLAMVFADAVASERTEEEAEGTGGASGSSGMPGSLTLASAPPPAPALVPREVPQPVAPEEVSELFNAVAQRPDLVAGFEPRPGQVQMGQAVARAAADRAHLTVEAGTGTGKSLAYLLPSLLHASRNDDRVLISTHTLNLQEQLAGQDIPAAAALVELHEGRPAGSVRAAVLKGRGNYLCLECWAEARSEQAELTASQARLFSRIATWLPLTESGDSGELYMRPDDRPHWGELSAEGTDCLSRQCPYVLDGSCFVVRARQRAAAAHVVVVNHALLLTAAGGASQALPPFRHLVIDEAHRLEDVATEQYGTSLSLRELGAMLEDVASAGGTAGRLRAAASADAAALSPAAGLVASADTAAAAAASAGQRLEPLAAVLRDYAEERSESRSDSGPAGELALGSGRHSQPLWADVEEAATQLDVTLLYLEERLRGAREIVEALPESAAPGLDRLRGDLGRDAEIVNEARHTLVDVTLRDDPRQVLWMRVERGDVRMNVAPLEVAGRLIDDLYAGCDSVVATSATLTAAGSFDYTTAQLGLIEPDTLQVPSPFDFRRSVLAIAVDDVPQPNAPGYAAAAHRALADAAHAASGRTLALFTSRSALRAAAGALRDPLAASGITLLAQGVDGSPARLLRSLAERPRTLLLGTAAFWEGVDVRGDALSQIVVARLPFPVPIDPVYAARAEQYEDPFSEYALPRAILRFRQGFGRLIRGSSERGVFVVLDSRLANRDYGEAFIDALPDCEVRRLPASAVEQSVAGWLA